MILKAHDTSVELITTGDFMSRFCGSLSLSRDVQKAATHIAKKAVDLDIVPGRSPISVAAAAIYMASQASDDKRTQREIADIAGELLSFWSYLRYRTAPILRTVCTIELRRYRIPYLPC